MWKCYGHLLENSADGDSARLIKKFGFSILSAILFESESEWQLTQSRYVTTYLQYFYCFVSEECISQQVSDLPSSPPPKLTRGENPPSRSPSSHPIVGGQWGNRRPRGSLLPTPVRGLIRNARARARPTPDGEGDPPTINSGIRRRFLLLAREGGKGKGK